MPRIGAVDAHHHLWDLSVSHYAWLHPNPAGDPFPDFEKICRDYTIEDYRAARLPLSAVNTILASWIARFEEPYLATQTYFAPFPEDLIEITGSGKGRGK